MTVKDFLEALKNNLPVVIRESDNTQIAEFNWDSYKAISESYLKRDVDDIEIVTKSAVSVIVTLGEVPEAEPESPPDTSTTE